MVYEKVVKKRQAKGAKEKRIRAIENCRNKGIQRYATGDGHLMIRESKMRRFCNFWLILFNVRSLKPFAQFIKQDEFKELKLRITVKVNDLLKAAERDTRGHLERCVSHINDLSIPSERELKKMPSGRPRLTREMLE